MSVWSVMGGDLQNVTHICVSVARKQTLTFALIYNHQRCVFQDFIIIIMKLSNCVPIAYIPIHYTSTISKIPRRIWCYKIVHLLLCNMHLFRYKISSDKYCRQITYIPVFETFHEHNIFKWERAELWAAYVALHEERNTATRPSHPPTPAPCRGDIGLLCLPPIV